MEFIRFIRVYLASLIAISLILTSEPNSPKIASLIVAHFLALLISGFYTYYFIKWFERWRLEDSEIEPDFKKEFESKFKEYGLFHENPSKTSIVIKDIIDFIKIVLNLKLKKELKVDLIDNMSKIDLVDYVKNEGILVKSKDSKKDIIESVLKLKLKKELEVDLIRYCNLIGLSFVRRKTKEQVIDALIEFKKQNIKC